MRRCGKNLTSVTGNLEKCLRTSSSVNLGGSPRTKMREDSMLAVCGLSCGLLQRRRHTGRVSVVRKLLGKKFKKYLACARPTLVGRLVAPACALARCNNTNTNTTQDHKHNASPTRFCTSTTKQSITTDQLQAKTPSRQDGHRFQVRRQDGRPQARGYGPCILTGCHETS